MILDRGPQRQAWRDLASHPAWRAATAAAETRWHALMAKPAPANSDPADQEIVSGLMRYLRFGPGASIDRLMRICTGDCNGDPNLRDLVDGDRVDVRILAGQLELATRAAVAPSIAQDLDDNVPEAMAIVRSIYQRALVEPQVTPAVVPGALTGPATIAQAVLAPDNGISDAVRTPRARVGTAYRVRTALPVNRGSDGAESAGLNAARVAKNPTAAASSKIAKKPHQTKVLAKRAPGAHPQFELVKKMTADGLSTRAIALRTGLSQSQISRLVLLARGRRKRYRRGRSTGAPRRKRWSPPSVRG